MTNDMRSSQSLARALDWITDNLHQFDPFVDQQPNLLEGGQRASELAVALYCCSRHGTQPFAAHERPLTAFLERLVARREFSDRLLRSPGGLVLLLYIHAALRQQGKSTIAMHETLQRLVAAGYLEQDERPPYRQMDLVLALDWANLHSGLPSWDDLTDASILSQPFRVPFTSIGSTYAYTHGFFFSFGFGTQRAPSGRWFDPQEAQHTLSMLLMTFCLERDWDLVGELLLCWECAGLEETSISRKAWEVFLSQQQETGAFSGPEKRGKNGNPNTDADRRYFARHYHTTLVAIMAMSCRLSVPDRIPEDLVGGIGRGVSSKELPVDGMSVEQAVERTSAWLRSFANGLPDSPGRSRPDALCRALVASWICAEVAGDDGRMGDVIDTIANAIADLDPGDENWSAVPSGLKLICSMLLSRVGMSALRLDLFLEQALAILAEEPSEDAEDDLPLCEKRTMLFTAGLLPEPTYLDPDAVVAFARAIDLHDLDGQEALAHRVESYAGYGTRKIDPPSECSWIAELLEGAAMHCLRVYDLARAGRFIRALARLGEVGQHAAANCSHYLLLQHQPNGVFGVFGSERNELSQAMREFDPEADLELPILLESIWTIAETLGPGWSLYDSLPRFRETAMATENILGAS